MNIDDYYPYSYEEMERRMSEQPLINGDLPYSESENEIMLRLSEFQNGGATNAQIQRLVLTEIRKAKEVGKDKQPRMSEPRPELEVDTPVWVRSDVNVKWLPRHFAQWQDHGCSCWRQGRTSHTAESKICWPCWSLTKPETNE